MAGCEPDIGFVPMISISKHPDRPTHLCSQWVATEKVHGSSFQFYTSDGKTLNVAGRRRAIEADSSFVKCDIRELVDKYENYALKLWERVTSQDKWACYRDGILPTRSSRAAVDKTCEEDGQKDAAVAAVAGGGGGGGKGGEESVSECEVRMYGELYGGGGVEKDVKDAVQKEVIYCDDHRFYVFGITINARWVTIAELGELCEEAGFPYYAKPLCQPQGTPDALRQLLTDTGFLNSRSTLTEKEGAESNFMEGVVMSPLKKPDFELHAIKFLFPAFSDVRHSVFGKKTTTEFCTKQRYHSVISKLDIPERQDAKMVVDMFVEDIIKESSYTVANPMLKAKWSSMALQWLLEDEYITRETVETFELYRKKRNVIALRDPEFVPMPTIASKAEKRFLSTCRDWVATEKVNGASFQMSTKDGMTVNVGSRRKRQERDGSFLKCDLSALLKTYEEYALKLWRTVRSEDKWGHYRDTVICDFSESADVHGSSSSSKNTSTEDGKADNAEACSTTTTSGDKDDERSPSNDECYVRIYGELYGGGGIKNNVKCAVLDETIYCDDFRFYVFGVTVNCKWLNTAEVIELCQKAGFPYHVKPLCDEPKGSVTELFQWLRSSNLVRSRSALTEKEGNEKTSMEGVVMTPLTRPDFRFYGVKLHFPETGDDSPLIFGYIRPDAFCNKQRFDDVLGLLDEEDRRDVKKVFEAFVNDLVEEYPGVKVTGKQKGIWRNAVVRWMEEEEQKGEAGDEL